MWLGLFTETIIEGTVLFADTAHFCSKSQLGKVNTCGRVVEPGVGGTHHHAITIAAQGDGTPQCSPLPRLRGRPARRLLQRLGLPLEPPRQLLQPGVQGCEPSLHALQLGLYSAGWKTRALSQGLGTGGGLGAVVVGDAYAALRTAPDPALRLLPSCTRTYTTRNEVFLMWPRSSWPFPGAEVLEIQLQGLYLGMSAGLNHLH